MKINLQRIKEPFLLEARNSSGNLLRIDGSPEAGGGNGGFRPMEALMASLAGCASIDFVLILKKQRQDLIDLRIEVEGERAKDATPAPFTSLTVRFHLYGDIDPAKAERAAALSMEKYCSVGASLDPSIRIEHTVEIHASGGES